MSESENEDILPSDIPIKDRKQRVNNRRRKIQKKLLRKNKNVQEKVESDIGDKIKAYLLSFEENKNWKFNKTIQKAILSNMYFKDKVSFGIVFNIH